jgi:hypothetical protein
MNDLFEKAAFAIVKERAKKKQKINPCKLIGIIYNKITLKFYNNQTDWITKGP